MPGNVLSAIITADGTRFTKTLGDLQSQLKRFESALKTTSNVESFNRLNRAIDATKQKIATIQAGGLRAIQGGANQATQAMTKLGRIVQDAPFGFLGISNNLNPLLESFQRLKQTTGSTGSALKALGSSLLGAGGVGFALSLVTSLLVVFGDKLFGAAAASKESEEALKSYSDALDKTKKSVNDLSTALQFANELGGLNAKIFNLSDVTDLNAQVVAQRQATFDLKEQRDQLKATGAQIVADTRFNAEDRAKAIKDNADEVEQLNSKIIDSERKTTLLYRQTALQRITDAKKLADEQKKAFEKFFNDTLKRAQDLDEFFSRTVIPLHFDFDPQASKSDILTKALAFIDKAIKTEPVFLRENLRAVIPGINLDIKTETLTDEVKKKAEDTYAKSREEFEKNIKRLAENNPLIIATNIKFQDAARKRQEDEDFANQILSTLGLVKSTGDPFKDMQLNAANAAKTIDSTLKPAFDELFDAIQQGKSPLEAFFKGLGQSVQQLIQQLIQAAIKALIISALFPGGAGGVKGFGSIFKSLLGFRADGGPVGKGKPFVVGERGPELFVPNTAGRIVPNHDFVSQGRSFNFSQQQIQVAGALRLEGKDLVAALAINNASQRRTA